MMLSRLLPLPTQDRDVAKIEQDLIDVLQAVELTKRRVDLLEPRLSGGQIAARQKDSSQAVTSPGRSMAVVQTLKDLQRGLVLGLGLGKSAQLEQDHSEAIVHPALARAIA